ncbi:Translation initiation factor 4B [Mycena venus]|uniref:Translation initiation factor 4B n=1 Tax=Mycena venus TaxID=2733690 RepID=A0A8H7CAY6_9AGAR|nr:Translation initiation factor 4B [Mycena venus]
MPPKKAKKISLNEFLGDSALGSWADEMESLPSAPAVRTDEEQARGNDRFGRRGDDFLSTRPDRQGPPREDLPLPTQPPYTAFIGNLAFDLTEQELEEFFGSSKTKSIKIIKDREDKPKGFGYIEFEDLDGLKDALAKSGSNFSGRTIRVSVAEPPKERAGFSGSGFEDDSKFDNPWRRDGPLPPSSNSRDSSRRRFDGPPGDRSLPSVSEGPSDWRSSRPTVARTPTVDTDSSSFRRKGSGFSTPVEPSPADREEVWAIGSKFKPAPPASEDSGSRFGSIRGRTDMPAAKEDEADWRSARPKPVSRDSVSPNTSTPPTPQLNRRKLELLPRSGNASNAPSPLSSPKIGPTPPVSGGSAARSSPFGAARPVDVTGREKEVTEKVEKEREIIKEKLTMSRTNSRTATERTAFNRTRTPPPGSAPQSPKSPKLAPCCCAEARAFHRAYRPAVAQLC